MSPTRLTSLTVFNAAAEKLDPHTLTIVGQLLKRRGLALTVTRWGPPARVNLGLEADDAIVSAIREAEGLSEGHDDDSTLPPAA